MTAHGTPGRYAEAMRGWQSWQKAYRFGVILIYPPEPIGSLIDQLRAEHDPISHRSCAAHISLSVAAPCAPSDEQWEVLESALSARSPITIKYGPVKTYANHPGVVLQIEPQSELDSLRAVVESFAPFSAAPARRWPFSAHMTIAEFITPERSAELVQELRAYGLQGEFLCSQLAHAVPDESFRFTEHRRLPLARSAVR